jgi:hypothetical protein
VFDVILGMDLDLYGSSPEAHVVWDSADAHLISTYNFSIVGIVCETPRKRRPPTLVGSGVRGQAIRERYVVMT